MFQDVLDFLMKFGPWGLFIHSFFDAVIFPIPAFFLQVSLSMLHPSTALWLATYGFIGCLLGTPIGYLIGKLLGKSVLYKILKKEWIDAATERFQKNGEAAILVGSFTPIPFKVFTILSGCLNFPLWRLMAYAAIGRATKFYVVGTLFYLYGNAAEGMVKNVSLYIFIIAVPLLLLGVYWNRRRKRKRNEVIQSETETEKPVLESKIPDQQTPSA
ncbi:membrane protein YqaA, SNARE-associated domain [Paenibacillus uliginis N3/975]|uniref:Membrane protein YqaA, SNARE-associated domain n=1 Tax=Paenibacillus uliginis N3/975 TaxID=1313296 RepID=A0A1X7GI96_9BACL|nr:VTT domain-containing protein [Paenibacillus uliginis]SMF70146.1 membrane protein YqaA, SNARE-associated domain [Paenibacillus uliginis N3/975]